MTNEYQIQFSQDIKIPLESELFSILGELLPISFIVDDQVGSNVQGLVLIDGKNVPNKINSLSVISFSDFAKELLTVETEVSFADGIHVPFPFRGRKLRTKLQHIGEVLSINDDEKVLVSCEQGPLWSISEMNGVKRFRSAMQLPQIMPKQNFNDVFNGEYFLEMLVLLEFIRSTSSVMNYQNAPLRATFIIDDPNLHWPSYGFFRYREIVDISERENFHVSFATIPLDAWYTHEPTAEIFRKNEQRISLLIHGNNHAKEELGLAYSEETRTALLGQAIERIERLEKKANVSVSRVMVPPHGACSNDMLAAMPKCGFESACISSGSLRFHNTNKLWVKKLGFFPSEIIEGCPVLPRWGLTGNVEITLLIAAYLGQPLILRGHHQDLKDGGGKFIEFARFINSLGDVVWSNMTDLSRLNYQWRQDGKTVWIKPFGRHIVFNLSKEAREIIIEIQKEMHSEAWYMEFDDGKSYEIFPGQAFLLTSKMKGKVTIKRATVKGSYVSEKDRPALPARLILRRLLTEIRDRLMLAQ